MKFNEFIITKIEVDRKCFIYDEMTSISFSEIEEEIKKRTKRLNISVYGEYDYKSNIEPFVYLQASYEGYKYRTILEKKIFNSKQINSYYDYLANNIIHQFSEKFFKVGEIE